MWVLRGIVETVLFTGLTVSMAFAQDTPAAKAEAVQAVADLDHSDWSVRERSTDKLMQLGAPALKALADCAANGSPEAALRAIDVLHSFYDRADFPAIERLEYELEKLQEAKGSIGEVARRAWETHWVPRERRAIAKIEELGGRVDLGQELRVIDADDRDVPLIEFVAIGPRWKGADDDIKHLLRLSRGWRSESKRLYRVKGAPLSEAAMQKLQDAGFAVDDRGAFLGIISTDPFGGTEQGCTVDGVRENSPADKGGLQLRDRILMFDDKPVKHFNDLIELLKASEPGRKVVFTVLRDGEKVAQTVELGNW